MVEHKDGYPVETSHWPWKESDLETARGVDSCRIRDHFVQNLSEIIVVVEGGRSSLVAGNLSSLALMQFDDLVWHRFTVYSPCGGAP
jgi:hypothetical protein